MDKLFGIDVSLPAPDVEKSEEYKESSRRAGKVRMQERENEKTENHLTEKFVVFPKNENENDKSVSDDHFVNYEKDEGSFEK